MTAPPEPNRRDHARPFRRFHRGGRLVATLWDDATLSWGDGDHERAEGCHYPTGRRLLIAMAQLIEAELAQAGSRTQPPRQAGIPAPAGLMARPDATLVRGQCPRPGISADPRSRMDPVRPRHSSPEGGAGIPFAGSDPRSP